MPNLDDTKSENQKEKAFEKLSRTIHIVTGILNSNIVP